MREMAIPRVVAIIQARISSSRLPGKVMLDLGGQPMLAHVIRRVRRAETLDDVCVATSDCPEDDAVAALAHSMGVRVFRGSLEDVLDRYVRAAELCRADVVVRVTGDCPFVEPEFIDRAVRHHLASGAEYTCAQLATEFPLGTGSEVVSLSALRQAWHKGTTPPDREHVTWYILSRRDEFKIEFLQGDDRLKADGVRIVVDTLPDLELAREIVARLSPDNPDFSLREILALWRRDPVLFKLNAGVERNPTLCLL